MKNLITGANGFLGSAVLRHLLNADHEARALLRSGSNRDNLAGLELEVMEGDLCDSASLKKAGIPAITYSMQRPIIAYGRPTLNRCIKQM